MSDAFSFDFGRYRGIHADVIVYIFAHLHTTFRTEENLSFNAVFFSSFPLAESPPRDLQITAYK